MSTVIVPPFSILLEDGPCLAVSKPCGLLTEGPPGVPSLVREVKDYLRLVFRKPAGIYLGIPHRLDRPASGVVLFARNSKAARRLSEQFEARTVSKTYLCIVEGEPQDGGDLEDWLRKVEGEARVERASPTDAGAKEARLSYRTLARGERFALLEVQPTTGRMHQIRVQLAARGHPIAGDRLYGSSRDMSTCQSGPRREGVPGPEQAPIALHHYSLTFRHPVRYDLVSVTDPVPRAWSDFFGSFEGLPLGLRLQASGLGVEALSPFANKAADGTPEV